MARVVAIAAHPDDETMFAGGTLAKYAAEGNEVVIVCTTRGEGGEVGDPPLGPKERLGEIREQEMQCAAGALGAADLIFLGFVDPAIEIGEPPQPIAAPFHEFSAAIAGCLARLFPDIVITHGSSGEYGHPQHVYTHHAVRAAVASLAPWHPQELLTWLANPGNAEGDRLINQQDAADIVIDVTPWLEAKAAALDCHRTQHAMIRRNTKTDNVRTVLRRTETFHRWPVAPQGAAADD